MKDMATDQMAWAKGVVVVVVVITNPKFWGLVITNPKFWGLVLTNPK